MHGILCVTIFEGIVQHTGLQGHISRKHGRSFSGRRGNTRNTFSSSPFCQAGEPPWYFEEACLLKKKNSRICDLVHMLILIAQHRSHRSRRFLTRTLSRETCASTVVSAFLRHARCRRVMSRACLDKALCTGKLACRTGLQRCCSKLCWEFFFDHRKLNPHHFIFLKKNELFLAGRQI